MSKRNVQLVILCEDRQHEAFARRFLEAAGWNVGRQTRIVTSPRGRGAGEQWVRERYPIELEALRRRPVSTALVVMVDADRASIEERLAALDLACEGANVAVRSGNDRVALFVPKRNIETWLAYLGGASVNEDEVYPRLARERLCATHVKALKGMCDAGSLRSPAPPSLQVACVEYRRLAQP